MASLGKTVVIITLEMSEMVYAKRISSQLSQIPIGQLPASTDSLREKVIEYKTSHPQSKIILKEFPPNTVTPNQIGGFIKKLGRKGIKPDAIVLDYINLLQSTVGTNSYERIKHVTEQVRALSYTFECPIISATQINRTGFNEIDPGVETISESVGLAATADCIMSIWQEDGDKDLGRIQLGMMKNRFGANFGHLAMKIDYNTLTLEQDESINETEESLSSSNILDNFTSMN